MGRCCSLFVGVVVIVCTALGCGPGLPQLGTITGTVRYAGKPVAGAIIIEVPGKRPASGKIVDGVIRDVTTYAIGDGAPVGTGRVAIHAFAPAAESEPVTTEMDSNGRFPKGYMGTSESLIPLRYNNPETSGITVVIEPGENTLSLDLQP